MTLSEGWWRFRPCRTTLIPRQVLLARRSNWLPLAVAVVRARSTWGKLLLGCFVLGCALFPRQTDEPRILVRSSSHSLCQCSIRQRIVGVRVTLDRIHVRLRHSAMSSGTTPSPAVSSSGKLSYYERQNRRNNFGRVFYWMVHRSFRALSSLLTFDSLGSETCLLRSLISPNRWPSSSGDQGAI